MPNTDDSGGISIADLRSAETAQPPNVKLPPQPSRVRSQDFFITPTRAKRVRLCKARLEFATMVFTCNSQYNHEGDHRERGILRNVAKGTGVEYHVDWKNVPGNVIWRSIGDA